MGNDFAKSLSALVKTDPYKWKPTLKASEETDKEIKIQ